MEKKKSTALAEKCHCEKKLSPRTDEAKKEIISRLNRIIGQLGGVKKMIESDAYCTEVLILLSACEKATRSVALKVFNEHLHSCVMQKLKNGDADVADETVAIIQKLL